MKSGGLAYLADIFHHVNEFGKGLQCPYYTILGTRQNQGFQQRTWLHQQRREGVYSFTSENEIELNSELAANVKEYCRNLIRDFKQYFPQNLTAEFCIRDHLLLKTPYQKC
jgi:hypothetical protein